MWLFTSFGVFMPGLRPPETIPAGDDKTIQIRVRRRKELEILQNLYMPDMGEIIHFSFTDYEYRTYCTPQRWSEVVATIARNIDYVKFKETTERYEDKELHQAYIEIWHTLYRRFSTNRYLKQVSGWWKGTEVAVPLEEIDDEDEIYEYTIELESDDFPSEMEELVGNLPVRTEHVTDSHKVHISSDDACTLALIVRRFESGDWGLPTDDAPSDVFEAEQIIEQYLIN